MEKRVILLLLQLLLAMFHTKSEGGRGSRNMQSFMKPETMTAAASVSASEENRGTSAFGKKNSSHAAILGAKFGNNVMSNDASLEVIQAGWHVNPHLYGDSATRFFTRWTADGYLSTGCYNTLCEGFIKVVNAPVSPGDVLPVSTPDAHHELRIWIEKDHTGDWWLYASTESSSSGQVGHWPNSLFSKLAQSASDVNFGGLVQAIKGSPSPPMGSGYLPMLEGSAPYFADVAFADQTGRKVAGILPSVVTNKACYDVGNLKDARFVYGGPGGCITR